MPVPPRSSSSKALLRLLRPFQWIKNGLVFVPLITASAFTDLRAWLDAGLVFLAFSATASAVYIINDARDVTADRLHEEKRHRPFAAEVLTLGQVWWMLPLLVGIGGGLAWLAGAIAAIGTYLLLALAYVFFIKRLAVLDVFVLAVFYVLRLWGGHLGTGYRATAWLYSFAGFFFLSLSLLKRVSELQVEQPTAGNLLPGRGYTHHDHPLLLAAGMGATFSASIILALYVRGPNVAQFFEAPHWLWILVPLLLFWQCRIWLHVLRKDHAVDPVAFIVQDPQSWAVLLIAIGCAVVAHGMFVP